MRTTSRERPAGSAPMPSKARRKSPSKAIVRATADVRATAGRATADGMLGARRDHAHRRPRARGPGPAGLARHARSSGPSRIPVEWRLVLHGALGAAVAAVPAAASRATRTARTARSPAPPVRRVWLVLRLRLSRRIEDLDLPAGSAVAASAALPAAAAGAALAAVPAAAAGALGRPLPARAAETALLTVLALPAWATASPA